MGTDLDLEIRNTRVGGFGSSDAKMIVKVGRIGVIDKAAKLRISQMLGLEEVPNITSPVLENGKRREQEIYQFWEIQADTFSVCKSNPYYRLQDSKYEFDVFNHIDIEEKIDDNLLWYEIKTSKYHIYDLLKMYSAQLAWHYMLLKNQAKTSSLYLLHYAEDYTNSPFDQSNICIVEIYKDLVEYHIELMLKGLELINKYVIEKYGKQTS